MEEQIFKEEQDKLEEINEKITEEENIIEDDLKNAETQMQKLTDKKIEEIEKILENKEKEVMSI